MPGRPSRLSALDGMRGLAALIVFLHHVLTTFYPALMGNAHHPSPVAHRELLTWLQHWPIGWLFNGPFAVHFFFVLSGFVLTLQVRQNPAPNFAHLVLRRLLRLFPLVAVASIGAFLLFQSETHALDALGQLNGISRDDYFSEPLLKAPTLVTLAGQLLYVIWRGAPAQDLFDPVLWSIGAELQGSLLVYMFLAVFSRLAPRPRIVASFILAPFLMGPRGLCFITGMAAAEAYNRRGCILPMPPWTVATGAGIALLHASINPWIASLWLPFPWELPEGFSTALQSISALLLLTAAVQLPRLQAALCTRPITLLGFASYGLYVVHMPLLYALGGSATVRWAPSIGFDAAVWSAALGVLIISLVAGYMLIRWVDTPLNRVTRGWLRALI